MSDDRTDQLQVPILDLTAQHQQIEPELTNTIEEIFAQNAFIMGEELQQFESEFASYCGVEHCVGVSSGTEALKLALRAAEIGPGDEVITVPMTFIATVEAICDVGAEPVFVDIDPDRFTLDPDQLKEAITERTAAVIPVHLYGQPADMGGIRSVAQDHGLTIVEDACQAHGARWNGERAGSLGHLGCFSFYPGKNLGAAGDAGCVTTSDGALAERVRMLRNHGQREGDEKYNHVEMGYNARMDNLHAAVLRLKLEHLDRWNEARREHARDYDRELEDMPGVRTPAAAEDAEHVYHQYAIRIEQRDRVQELMDGRGVQCRRHYPRPLHVQDACSFLDHGNGDFPVSERVASNVLTLPCFPELSDEQQEHVVNSLRHVLAAMKN